MKKQKRVAIVHPFSCLDSLPSLCNTAILLAKNGYKVDIYNYCDNAFVNPQFEHDNISILSVHFPTSSKGSIWRSICGRIYWRLHKYLWLLQFIIRHLKIPCICIIGVDPQGLVLANFFSQFLKVRLAYYSFELLLSYELITDNDSKLKEQERKLGKKSAFIITQDEERATILSRDSDISINQIICVPNSPLGLAERKTTNYLREKFNIPSDTKIILNTGALSTWSCIPQLIKSTVDWPDNWVLVIHTRYYGSCLNRDYVFALQCMAKPERVIFSFNPIPQNEYQKLVQSADIGVAFYCVQEGSTYTQDNIRYIGLSSGKLAYYLQAGLPVLVNTNSSLERLVANHKCGEVARDPANTIDAIKSIFDNYENYSENAVSCFNEKLDFSDKFELVLKAIESDNYET